MLAVRTVALAATAATAVAQHAPPFSPAGVAQRTLVPVVAVDAEVLRADAAGYKASFGIDDFEFVPAFGPAAPQNFPLRYELRAIGRGEELQAVASARRRHDDQRVEFVRGDVIERYDLLAAGIEQSFVLDTLPPGTGDLVVRGRLNTELAVSIHAGGLRLDAAGIGHCTLGAVTGIDAAGRRVPGTVEYHEGVLDYRLPAAWLETAALPIVVDPLFGSSTQIPNAQTGFDELPDVAYDVTNDVYLVVFVRQFSASDFDIHAQRVDRSGGLIGNRILVDNSGGFDFKPQVANVNLRDRFVVVWQRGNSGNTEVRGRAVSASNGSMAAFHVIAAQGEVHQDPDIGGEATENDEDAICVWHNVTQDEIIAAQIGVNADGTIFEHDVTAVAGLNVEQPCISKSGGSSGRHMIGWMRRYSANDLDPRCAVLDRQITGLAGRTLDTAVNFTGAIDIDGDGNQWVVSWQVREGAGLLHDVVASSVSYIDLSQTTTASSITPVADQSGIDETDPSVCWLGNATLVGYTNHQTASATSAWVRSIDSHTCLECETSERLVASLSDDAMPVAASVRSGGGTTDEAMCAWQRRPSGGGWIYVAGYRSDGGIATTLNAGCGDSGGIASATCAKNGNSGFAVRVTGAEPNTTAWLVGSRTTASIPCGPCAFVPNPYAGFVHTATTDSSGAASLPIPIPASPSFVGVEVYLQWAVFEPVTPGCYLFLSDLSSAIKVTVE